MSFKVERSVISIPRKATHDWLLNKHYAQRIPTLVHTYGVFENGVMQGVCTYGIPPSPPLTTGVCGEEYKDIVLELNRLVLVEDHSENLASYFVAQTLRMLPTPSIVVSYIYIRQLTSCIQGYQLNVQSGERWVLTPIVVQSWVNIPTRKGQIILISLHRSIDHRNIDTYTS